MMSRPFGVALLIAGIDELGPQLYVSYFTLVPIVSDSSQLPYRPFRHICALRCKSNRLWF
jgi:hypothetical protein